jgi:hypothetical protein
MRSSAQVALSPDIPLVIPGKPSINREENDSITEQSLVSELVEKDSAIESATDKVIEIIRTLKIDKEESAKRVDEFADEGPEDAISRLQAGFREVGIDKIDDILEFLAICKLDIGSLRKWQIGNEEHLASQMEELENTRAERDDLEKQLKTEEDRNWFMRIWRRKERHGLAAQLQNTSRNAVRLGDNIHHDKERLERSREKLTELSEEHESLVLNAVENLFKSVIEQNQQLKKSLADPVLLDELNNHLFARMIQPKLDELQREGKITPEEADEYIQLLKTNLAEGTVTEWNDPPEVKAELKERIERMDELNRLSGYELRDLGRSIGSGNGVANSNYERIFDVILREKARSKIESIKIAVGNELAPDMAEEVNKIADKFINGDNIDWVYRHHDEWNCLDIAQRKIDDIKELRGMERWEVARLFAMRTQLASPEDFARVEHVLINRLFSELLFPGGYESWEGTEAAGKIADIGNPAALPLLLHHIETHGSGHTSNSVVYVMEKLLRESDPVSLEFVLAGLPDDKRLLLRKLADEDSYLSRFGKSNSRYTTCSLLQDCEGTLRQEKYAKILEDEGVTEEELGTFYLLSGIKSELLDLIKRVAKIANEDPRDLISLYFNELTNSIGPNYPSSLDILNVLAEELGVSKTDLLIRCIAKFENPPKNNVLKAIASPTDGDIASFPMALAKSSFGLDDEQLGKLAEIYQSKTLQKGVLEREHYLEGMMLLRSKENGAEVISDILGAYQGTRSDPKRIRRIFQLLYTLEGFGAYSFSTPDPAELEELNQEIVDLTSRRKQAKDKAERKEINDRIDTLKGELRNRSGLKGIEDILRGKVVDAACEILDLPQEYRDIIDKNLDKMLNSGILEIIPTLAGKYESEGESEVKMLLKTITGHIIEEDFETWKYSHEQSEAQLVGLTEEQRDFWIANIEPVTIDIALSESDESRRDDELKAAQGIIRNCKEHILSSQPDFEFSRERFQIIAANLVEITEKIRNASNEEEKSRLIAKRRVAEAEAALIIGVLEIEEATASSYTRDSLLRRVAEMSEGIEELKLPLAGLDLEQIEKIFTVGDIEKVTASESDDALTLLRVGVEPQETCQSWRNGGFNECLLAYVADANKKVINITDSDGRIVARSIVKLTYQRNSDDPETTKRRTLLIERPYSLLPNDEVYRVFIRLLLAKAEGLDSSITFSSDFDEGVLRLFKEEAQAFGYSLSQESLEIYLPQSLNKYEYSDTLGGKKNWFNKYESLKGFTLEKAVS